MTPRSFLMSIARGLGPMERGVELEDRPVGHAEVTGEPVDDAAALRRRQRVAAVVDGLGHLEGPVLADEEAGLGRDDDLGEELFAGHRADPGPRR